MRLRGKVAVITGSTSGIGKSSAILFAGEGAKVVIVGRDEKRGESVASQIKKKGGQAIFVKTDVSVEEDVKNLMNTVSKKWGWIDVLFNNAGVEFQAGTGNTEMDKWEWVININLKGVFLCTKHALKHMRKGGSIINTSSIAGMVGLENLTAYSASKGGVVMLTRQNAADLVSKGIRVNCICPGPIDTPMIERFLRNAPKHVREGINNMTPMKRMGRPEEVANLALFLASDESSYMTGTVIPIDGGMTAID